MMSLIIGSAGGVTAQAQDVVFENPVAVETTSSTKTKRITRIEEPVPYWVEADQLRIRDNPYAGDVIGMLKIGQKVHIRKTVDDWVLISAANNPEQWVNRNFLSPSPVTWASYNFESRSARNLKDSRFSDARYDIKKKRIKIRELKGVRVYAADIKRLSGNQKIVISRHDYRAGPYFEKRLVKCDDSTASHVKILGEGYTVMMMDADPRNQRIGVPMSDEDQIENESAGIMDTAIAEFTCETDSL
jgi:hypothetical protein